MSGSHADRRRHRRKVAGTAKGLQEHTKRDKRRGRGTSPPGEGVRHDDKRS